MDETRLDLVLNSGERLTLPAVQENHMQVSLTEDHQLEVSPDKTIQLGLAMQPDDRVHLELIQPGRGGTKDYNELINKPSINRVTLVGNKELLEIGAQPAGDYADAALTNSEIENLLSRFV